MRNLFLFSFGILFANFASAAKIPSSVICSTTFSVGSNPETGEGGTRFKSEFYLVGSGRPMVYDLYYKRGASEGLYISGLTCQIENVPLDPEFTCDQIETGIKECVKLEPDGYLRKIVADPECVNRIGFRVANFEFTQTKTPKQSGGCYIPK